MLGDIEVEMDALYGGGSQMGIGYFGMRWCAWFALMGWERGSRKRK